MKIRVPGKWVLTGEHTVLRGGGAIALPHPDVALSLDFDPSERERLVIQSDLPVLELIRTLKLKAHYEKEITGTLKIQNTIPIGGGLGSSAALCVAMTRWFEAVTGHRFSDSVAVATGLEDFFHGKSSGMDVAVVAAGRPIYFNRTSGSELMDDLKLAPRFTFHDTGLRTRTSDSISHVLQKIEIDPVLGESLDRQMKNATTTALEGLKIYPVNPAKGLELISAAMEKGHECFESWGLVPDAIRTLKMELIKQGAKAVKLTGAGGGGFLVAVWES